MFYTDNPLNDFENWQAQQDAKLERMPICDECENPIQDEEYCLIAGKKYCLECIENSKVLNEEI